MEMLKSISPFTLRESFVTEATVWEVPSVSLTQTCVAVSVRRQLVEGTQLKSHRQVSFFIVVSYLSVEDIVIQISFPALNSSLLCC